MLPLLTPTTSAHDSSTQQTEPHGWPGTEMLNTRFGDFKFEGGYPVGDATQRLLELRTLNRAIEVYSTQLMAVSEIAVKEGLRAFGATKPTQVVIWENLMDSGTVLLTANTETVYAIAHLDLKADCHRSAAANAWLYSGRSATLPCRHRPAWARQR